MGGQHCLGSAPPFHSSRSTPLPGGPAPAERKTQSPPVECRRAWQAAPSRWRQPQAALATAGEDLFAAAGPGKARNAKEKTAGFLAWPRHPQPVTQLGAVSSCVDLLQVVPPMPDDISTRLLP